MKRWMAGLLFCAGALPVGASDLFQDYWSDGKAELSGYELVQPRYGQLRHGQAVLIFVTEPFSRSRKVKVDHYDPANPDHFIALKLNFIRKFQTGIYDYSVMSSVFTDPARGFEPVKISFSSQEWCGHVYQELLFDPGSILNRVSSYFEGESKEERMLSMEGAWPEDVLWIGLRQLDREALSPVAGRRRTLGSLLQGRFLHQPLKFADSEFRESSVKVDTKPTGPVDAREISWTRVDGKSCSVRLESAYPHRILGWTCEDGEEARLTGSSRLAYWQENQEGGEAELEKLGLVQPAR